MNFLLKQIRSWFMFAAIRFFAQTGTQSTGNPSTNPAVFQNANATPFAADLNGGPIFITFAGATTVNIPPPTAGQDDNKEIEVYATTAFAHVLAFGANKLNGNKTSYTWTKATAGFIGKFKAFGGVWYITGNVADAAAFAQQVTLA